MLATPQSLSPELWCPQPGPQVDAISADWCDELLFGGAAGGGKSDYLLGDYLQDVNTYGQAWRGILFRRTYPELEELIARSNELYLPHNAVWNEQKKTWRFPSGATVKMRFLESERDMTRYQGHQYTWIGWDELTQWATLNPYKYLRARLRSAHDVPTKRIRCSANPGGVGHSEVKRHFIDHAPLGYVPRLDETTGHHIMFIPSKLSDNALLLRNDPGYAGRLAGLGSPELVRAWLEGDWSIIAGAFFSEFSIERHVVRPFELPKHWLKFAMADWGSAKPFAVLWGAVSDGDFGPYPRGSIIIYREWYGCDPDNYTKGLKLDIAEFAAGIRKRENDNEVAYRVMDTQFFNEDGGPSNAETARRHGVNFVHADKTLAAGYEQVRLRLRGTADSEHRPLLYFFDTCPHIARTLAALPHDLRNPEVADPAAEDHAPDALRYGLMSRVWVVDKPQAKKPMAGFSRYSRGGAQSIKVL